uniref:hypothetical protein n=1 Tax=Aeromonas enteropelogenes TaxID=29489 RepID=UPI001C86EBCC
MEASHSVLFIFNARYRWINIEQKIKEIGKPKAVNYKTAGIPEGGDQPLWPISRNKKPRSVSGVFGVGCLAVSYSRMANATLPSALQRFTSEFGMGSGG